MTPEEQDKLETIHDELRETRSEVHDTRTKVEVVDARTQRIEGHSDKLDNRVFGPDGLESQVTENSQQIGRLHGIAALVVGASGTAVAKLFNLLP